RQRLSSFPPQPSQPLTNPFFYEPTKESKRQPKPLKLKNRKVSFSDDCLRSCKESYLVDTMHSL
ncbi:MAG: hypothetical protein WAK17_23605, partial [Candidatus Nitrosopolaris sp.]